MKNIILSLLFLATGALAAEEPEAVYRKLHAAVLAGKAEPKDAAKLVGDTVAIEE
jgi:hypothetical protein